MAPTLDNENGIPIEKTARRASFVRTRKRLADISNTPQQSRPFCQEDYTKQCIDQLQKDNMALMSIVSEKNKTIAIMRIDLQKLQLQNVQLAQANRQMFAELNSDKDRLKVLQHELACKNGLLKAINMESEDKAKRRKCQKPGNEVGTAMCEKSEGLSLTNRVDNIPHPNGEQYKDQSVGPLTTKEVQGKEKADKKRLSCRRQSSRFREPKCSEDLFHPAMGPSITDQIQAEEMEDKRRHSSRRQSSRFKSRESGDLSDSNANFPVCPLDNDDQINGNNCTSSVSLVKNDFEEGIKAPVNVTVEIQSCLNSSDSVQKEEELFTAIGPSSTKQVKVKEKTVKKRLSSRRQSTRLKSRDPECTVGVFDLDDAKFPVCLLHDDDQIVGNVYTPSVSLLKNNFKEGNNAAGNGTIETQNGSNPSDSSIVKEDIEGKELRGRSSVGRPLRRAVERIHSYKEKPLKGKMRRSE